MKWKESLGRRKFYSILLASTIEMVVGLMMSLIDTVITGHIIGTAGLSVMNLITPALGFTVFTEGLFSVGASIVYASYKGEYQEKKADAAFTTGLICSIGLGIMTSLALIIIVPSYLSYMAVSDELKDMVRDFLVFIYPQLALTPVYQLLCEMVITDGGEFTGMVSNITETLLNLVLSIILGRKMGIMGIGLGTLISTLAAMIILLYHFLSKRNGLHLRFDFEKDDMKKMAILGANDSSMFFLFPILAFVTIKFVIIRFGEFYLPVLSIIYSVLELTVIFEATGEAMRPIMPIYIGDHNNMAVKNVMNYSMVVNLQRALVFSLLLVAAGPYIPAAFYIKDPVLLKECRHALWIYALACPGLSIVANFNSFYINTNKPYLAAMESILNNLVCILVLAIPFGMRFGLQGMMLGYAMAPYLTAVILLSYIYFHYGKERFPDLLPPSDDVILNRTIVLKEEEIMKFIQDSHEILEANHVDKKVEHSVELVLEEVLFLIMDKNRLTEHGKKTKKIYAEICERISSEGVDLSIWDSGEIFDITETDSELINFRSYFISRVLSRQEVKKHMVATSFNRNFFHFGENIL